MPDLCLASNILRTPAQPPGVFWKSTPIFYFWKEYELDILTGVFNANGIDYTVLEEFFVTEGVDDGMQQPYTVVVNFNEGEPLYEALAGEITTEGSNYVLPQIPANRIWVGNFLLTDTGFKPIPTGAIQSIVLPDGSIIPADATGKAKLPVVLQKDLALYTKLVRDQIVLLFGITITSQLSGVTVVYKNSNNSFFDLANIGFGSADVVFIQAGAVTITLLARENTVVRKKTGKFTTDGQYATVTAYSWYDAQNERTEWIINGQLV